MININFLWSKGLYKRNTYMLQKTPHLENEKNIKKEIENAEKFIWIRNGCTNYQKGIVNLKKRSDLDIFVNNLNLIKNPIILITTDGDRPVPSSYFKDTVEKILNSNKIIKWMTQNYDKTIIHPKLDYFPIGLDCHTQRWLINNSVQEKIDFLKKNRENKKNITTIFCDAHLHTTSNERILMYNKLSKNKDIIFLEKGISFSQIIEKYTQYKFVLSPVGNGFDCHRTWELFLMGCIVITKTSPLNEMWEKNNLPVVILNDWDELNNNLFNKLNEWIEKYDKFTEKEYILNKFNYDYWLNK